MVFSCDKLPGMESLRQAAHMSKALRWGWLKSGLTWNASTQPVQRDGPRVSDFSHSTSAFPESSEGPEQKPLSFV